MSHIRPPAHGQLDADAVLAFTGRLREIRARVDEAVVSDEQRHRWHARLAAISTGAAEDLQRATAQLHRLEAAVDRGA